ncbi:MAG: bifunctional precorrin-2 dehydrogenase/sirohydrochlorin ferrochelatase [Verrucomicrobiae bacterium]|nr:bifunctional precorrin-2 dehydrogenase/sirohydrochlorin ferrochelatase [Verrucomicrobiae bacterium]
MSTKWYPLFLDLRGKPVVVVGGGAVATRKVRALVQAGARVTVISPEITGALKRRRGLRWFARAYRRGDLRGAVLVVAATNNLAVNRAVCAEGKQRGLLVNCAAPPEAGNFIVPAVARRAGVTVAVSTSGVSPARAKALRRALEAWLRRRYPAAKKQRGSGKT